MSTRKKARLRHGDWIAVDVSSDDGIYTVAANFRTRTTYVLKCTSAIFVEEKVFQGPHLVVCQHAAGEDVEKVFETIVDLIFSGVLHLRSLSGKTLITRGLTLERGD